jgi:geranylgeranyl transferase type-2 subunit alpha
MHGKKRVGVAPPTPAELALTAQKIQQYKMLTSLAFRHRLARTASPDALELTGKLLAATPDVYTLWNYARETVLTMEGGLDDGALRSLVEAQLALTAAALRRSPKSYAAWHARRWLVERYRAGRPGAAAAAEPPFISLPAELALCAALLAEDERNFHCWNYRRWVAGAAAGAGPCSRRCTSSWPRGSASPRSARRGSPRPWPGSRRRG